ncbi:MAG: molybdenum cofactor biosynthesis protein [Candidatus Methanodesulfokora sp.]|jgi:molybdopterin synthase catalytic subunit
MQVRVRLFGSLRERAGTQEMNIELPNGSKVGDLLKNIESIVKGVSIMIAVNSKKVDEEHALSDGDVVAIFPPVSGGAYLSKDFDLTEALKKVKSSSRMVGAIVVFIGVVRERNEGYKVRKLSYEAYEDMAREELERIREEVLGMEGVHEAVIIHRIGSFLPGEETLLVVVGAEHRDQAFRAAEWAVEQVKRRVPIWKLEITDQGSFWIEGEERRRSSLQEIDDKE